MTKLNDFLAEALQNEFPLHTVLFPLQTWSRIHGRHSTTFVTGGDTLERIFADWDVFANTLNNLIGSDESFDHIRKDLQFIKSHLAAAIVCNCSVSAGNASVRIQGLANWCYNPKL